MYKTTNMELPELPELPIDIWATILKKTRSLKNCDKLYSALPIQTRVELKDIYASHKESLNLKIVCAFHNQLSVYNNDILESEIGIENIIAVRYVKNWNTKLGKKDCIVLTARIGVVYFWDAKTMEYIEAFDMGASLSDIEFHPTESIMLTVEAEIFGRKMKVWRFEGDRNPFTVTIEFLGDGKKLFYFHPTEPQIYIFISNYSYNPYHWKLSKVYFCNYDQQSIGFSDLIHGYLYLNNYYTPLKIREDGSFECIKYENNTNYFCNFRIDEYFEIKEVQLQAVLENMGIINSLVVWEFVRVGVEIYFYTNQIKSAYIYKQLGDQYKIIYQTSNKISQIFYKNGFFVFMENRELKLLDLDTLLVEGITMNDEPVDLCVL